MDVAPLGLAPHRRQRWVVRRIWRAFPELDTYSDHDCREFVRTANRAWLLRTLTLLLLVGAPVAAAVCAITTSTMLTAALRDIIQTAPRSSQNLVLTGIGLAMMFSAMTAAVVCLKLRDWLLWRRLRTVLHEGGHCGGCGYSFIGLVIPESLVLRCPECGQECTVDGALTVLSRGEDGTRTTAMRVVVSQQPRYWTRQRIRTWLRFGSLAAAVVLAPVLVGAAWLEWNVRSRAAEAAADMPTPEALRALLTAGRPGAAVVAVPEFMDGCTELDSRLESMAANLTMAAQFEAKRAGNPPADPDEPSLPWDLDQFRSVVPDLEDRPDMIRMAGSETAAEQARRAAARAAATLRAADAAGLVTSFRTLLQTVPYQIHDTGSDPATMWRYRLGYLTAANRLGAALDARARLAIAGGDTAAAEESLTLAMMLGSRVEEQPFAVEGLVGRIIQQSACDTIQRWLMSNPSAAEIDAVERVLRTPGTRGDPLLHFATATLQSQAFLADAYGDPGTVRWLVLTGSLSIPDGPSPIADAGSWADNRAALQEWSALQHALASSPPSKRDQILQSGGGADGAARAAPEASTGLMRALHGGRSYEAVERIQALAITRSTIAAMVALERWRLKHGAYPPTLDTLVPEVLPAVPLDLWSERPMGYRVLGPGEDPLGRPYLLWSHGVGGQPDEGPRWSSNTRLQEMHQTAPPGAHNATLNFHMPIPRGPQAPNP